MKFEWDEAKRASNLAKHGVDFAGAIAIWRTDVIDPISERIVDGERRFVAVGIAGDDEIVIGVVYTMRDGVRRIISARRGRRYERANYQSQFGRGR